LSRRSKPTRRRGRRERPSRAAHRPSWDTPSRPCARLGMYPRPQRPRTGPMDRCVDGGRIALPLPLPLPLPFPLPLPLPLPLPARCGRSIRTGFKIIRVLFELGSLGETPPCSGGPRPRDSSGASNRRPWQTRPNHDVMERENAQPIADSIRLRRAEMRRTPAPDSLIWRVWG